MKKIFVLLLTCFFGFHAISQNQAANWYFGENAGITFNTDNSITSGITSKIKTFEGCASISDKDGNLLFYTDGITIWNKFHAPMDNGQGLKGDPSSSQSAIIVPKPESNLLYYVFTVDDIKTNTDPLNRGLNYSIVNMSLDNGGGAVTEKNINLIPESSEKVTAVSKGCNGESIWVISFAPETPDDFDFTTFFAFEINASGLNTTPVKSTFNFSIGDGRGYLKLSPNGKKMVSANTSNGVFLYDFDVNTGIVSNEQILTKIDLTPSPYGVEFSPNNRFLYVNFSNDYFGDNSNLPSNHRASLIQFDLLATDIQFSLTFIDDRQLFRGALQLGPDGKIYRALSKTYENGLPYLGVIENPNNKGLACNYVHEEVNLQPFLSGQGLPPFITSYFNSKIDIIKNGKNGTNLEICENGVYTLQSINIAGANYSWTKDGNTINNNNYDLVVTEPGHYEVYIEPNNGECDVEGEAFVFFNENPKGFNYSIFQCDEDGNKDGFTIFNLEEALDGLTGGIFGLNARYYLDEKRTNIITNPKNFTNTYPFQIIYVEVYNTETGCKTDVELALEVTLTGVINTQISVCDDDGIDDGKYEFNLANADSNITNGLPNGLVISYFKNYEDALLEKNNLDNSYINQTPNSQTIYARVEYDTNCYGISEVTLIVNSLPQVDQEVSISYCKNFYPKTITINAGISMDKISEYSFNWSTGSSSYEIDINEIGTYNVEIKNLVTGCTLERTINVNASNIASFEYFEIKDASQENSITVFISGEGLYKYSLVRKKDGFTLPFQNSNKFEHLKPGIYTVIIKEVENNCGNIYKNISIIGFPKFFTPNNDGVNDTWQIYGASEMFQPSTKIMIYNRYGKLIKEITPIKQGWNGTSNGQLLPADDYWFTVNLEDGRIFKDHFTLKY